MVLAVSAVVGIAVAPRYAAGVHIVLPLLTAALATATSTTPPAPRDAVCKAAVLDLTPGEGVTLERARALTEIVTSEVSQHLLDGTCSVLSRAEIKALVSFEVERQLSGCDAASCLGEIGDALGVDHVVMGTISRIDARTLVSLRLVDMKAMRVERRVTDSFAGPDDDALPWIAWLAKRVALVNDTDAGARPVVDTPSVVERKATLWRTLAWTGLGTGVGALVVAAALGGTALGISTALPSLKLSNALPSGLRRTTCPMPLRHSI